MAEDASKRQAAGCWRFRVQHGQGRHFLQHRKVVMPLANFPRHSTATSTTTAHLQTTKTNCYLNTSQRKRLCRFNRLSASGTADPDDQ